jgi:hypothetical protein
VVLQRLLLFVFVHKQVPIETHLLELVDCALCGYVMAPNVCWVNTPETLLTYSHLNKGLRKISGVHLPTCCFIAFLRSETRWRGYPHLSFLVRMLSFGHLTRIIFHSLSITSSIELDFSFCLSPEVNISPSTFLLPLKRRIVL